MTGPPDPTNSEAPAVPPTEAPSQQSTPPSIGEPALGSQEAADDSVELLTPEELARARADINAMLGRDSTGEPDGEEPHAPEARILRRIDGVRTTWVDFSCWPFDGSRYHRHAILWTKPGPRDERVFDVLLKLYRRKLLVFLTPLIYVDGNLVLLCVDTGNEEWFEKYKAVIARLAAWAFRPLTVRVVRCEQADADFAGGIGCGVHESAGRTS